MKMPKAEPYKDEAETVTHTDDSIKAAETIVGGKMADPSDKGEQAKLKENVTKYHLADSDDEDMDTVETRRSIKSSEKNIKGRFFINAQDKRDYEGKVSRGEIAEDELNYKEDIDQDIGADPFELLRKEHLKK